MCVLYLGIYLKFGTWDLGIKQPDRQHQIALLITNFTLDISSKTIGKSGRQYINFMFQNSTKMTIKKLAILFQSAIMWISFSHFVGIMPLNQEM